MKYSTKRSKVEEVTIDLEDGCVIKVTRDNLVQFDTISIYDHYVCFGKKCSEFSHYESTLQLNNGVSYEFKILDKQLLEDIYSLAFV